MAQTITNVSPSSGPTAGNTPITITGSGFVTDTATGATVGGNALANFAVVDDSTISGNTPAGAAGPADVTVTLTVGGPVTDSGGFTYVAAPTVASVTPSLGPPGGGTGVTITGSNFDSSATVNFGTAAGTGVNFVSSSEVMATSPAHGGFGAVDVTVTTTTGGQSATSAADQFTYATAPGAPTGVSASPGNGSASVSWTAAAANGSPVSDYSVTSSPATTTQHAGTSTNINFTGLTDGISYTFTVVATNGVGPGPQSGASNSVTPTAGSPTVTSVTPNAGPTAGGTPVTITGTNFDSSATVSFGSSAASGVTLVSSSEVKATSPAGAAGTVNVTVTTSGGGTSGVNSADQFTYAVGPTIASLLPDIGTPAGGTAVTITGSGFTGTSTVFFGPTSAAFTVTDASHISATSPAGAAGVVTVTVTTPGGTASSSYTYAGVPTVTSLSPIGGPPTGGIPVTITGTSFIGPPCQTAGQTGCLTVNFGPAPATNVTVSSSTQIFATSPATFPPGAFGVVDVTVSTPFGTSLINQPGDQFTYALVPGAPQSVSALPGRLDAVVRWNAAASNGSAISGYTVTTTGFSPPAPLTESPTLACPSIYTCAVPISGLTASDSYTFTVTATNGFGSTTSTATAAVIVLGPGTACTSIFLTPSVLSPQVGGTSITFTAQALGCTTPVYEFWLHYPNGTTVLKQYWGGATWIWNTGGYPVGAYQLRLGANESGDSLASFEGKLSFPFTLVAGCTGAGITSSPPSPMPAGTSVTFTASSQACLSPQYQFWWQKQGTTKWNVGQAFGSTSTWTWNTSGFDPGGYTIVVWANQLGTPIATYQTYAVRTIDLTGCYPVSLTATPPSLQHAGSTVLLTAQASACAHPLYAFWVLVPGTSSWKDLTLYSATSTLTYTAPAQVGSYSFMVWAIDAYSGGVAGNGGGRWDSYIYIPYRLTSSNTCTSVTFTAAPSGSAVSGTTVNITATAAGCLSPLYQFWIYAPGGPWRIVQPYSSTNGYTWLTAGAVSGIYNLGVWARDTTSVPGAFTGSLGSWDALASSLYTLKSTPCTSVGASSVPAGTTSAGTPVTINAINTVGCPNPVYEIWVLAPGAGSWKLLESYPGGSSFLWNTTPYARGVYQFSIWVRDTSSIGTSGDSLGRWDAYTTLTYTLT